MGTHRLATQRTRVIMKFFVLLSATVAAATAQYPVAYAAGLGYAPHAAYGTYGVAPAAYHGVAAAYHAAAPLAAAAPAVAPVAPVVAVAPIAPEVTRTSTTPPSSAELPTATASPAATPTSTKLATTASPMLPMTSGTALSDAPGGLPRSLPLPTLDFQITLPSLLPPMPTLLPPLSLPHPPPLLVMPSSPPSSSTPGTPCSTGWTRPNKELLVITALLSLCCACVEHSR